MTLDELLTVKTTDQVLADLLLRLAAVGFPTMSWHATSVPYRLLRAFAGTYASFTELLVAVTKGGLLQYSSGAWLTLLAYSVYGLTRNAARFTEGTLTISDLAGVGPVSIEAGQLRFATASGKRYSNKAAFEIPLNSSVDFAVKAEIAGASMNVAPGEIVVMLTPLPGVGTATSFNPSPTWITIQGSDEESDPLLRQRCQDQWATLGYGQNDQWWRYYARNAPNYGSEVTRVKVTAGAGDGTIEIVMAGPSGPLGSDTFNSVSLFLNAIKGNCEHVNAVNATSNAISIPGTVYVRDITESAARSAIEESVDEYLASLNMGDTVYASQLLDAVQFSNDKVRNAILTVSDVVLGEHEVAVRGSLSGLAIQVL